MSVWLELRWRGPRTSPSSTSPTNAGRQTLRAAGAHNIAPYSVRWVTTLRPGAIKLKRLSGRLFRGKAPGVRDRLMTSFSKNERRLPTNLASRLVRQPRERPDGLVTDELTIEDVAEHGPRLTERFDLAPDFGHRPFVEQSWNLLPLVHSAEATSKVAVRSRRGALLGWYVLYAPREGEAELVQLVAQPEAQARVLTLVFHDALERGATTVRGDAPPHLLFDLSALGCTLYCRSSAMSAHSNVDDSFVEAFRRSSALVTGMEGEHLLAPASLYPGSSASYPDSSASRAHRRPF